MFPFDKICVKMVVGVVIRILS